MRILFGFLMLVLSGISTKVVAQCALTKTNTGAITKIEAPETYFYVRDKTVYNSAAVKVINVTKGKVSKTGFNIKFTTTTDGFVPQTLTLKLQNGSSITHSLTFKSKKITDNSNFKTNEFELYLKANDVTLLRIQLVQSLVFTNVGKTSIEIPVNDGSLLQQQINCLQK